MIWKTITGLVFKVLSKYGLKPDPDKTDSDLTDIESNYIQRNGTFEVMINDDGKNHCNSGDYIK